MSISDNHIGDLDGPRSNGRGRGFVWAWPHLSDFYPIPAILLVAPVKPYKASDFMIDTIHSRPPYTLPRTGNRPKSSRLPDVERDAQMYLNGHDTLRSRSRCDYALCSWPATSHVVVGHFFPHGLQVLVRLFFRKKAAEAGFPRSSRGESRVDHLYIRPQQIQTRSK